MKIVLTSFAVLLYSLIFSQVKFTGIWQGLLIKDGSKESEAVIFYVKFNIDGKSVSGKTREEIYETELYAIQKIKGTVNDHQIDFNQFVVESKKSSSKITWCTSNFTGKYTDSTGYIEGTFNSTTCKRTSGKFILYRSKAKFSESELPALGHAWRDVFQKELKQKLKAPEIRDIEMKNFKFQTIYFDHDKTDIKTEYHAYLIEMIRVVNSHSDLRIQVTGHTDAVGSDAYNKDLSRRRALAIEEFFKEHGFDLKKLKIDFKGESEPIDNNATAEGKRMNRRVDFKFIYE